MISILLRARRLLSRRESQLWQALGFLVVTLFAVVLANQMPIASYRHNYYPGTMLNPLSP